MISHTACTYTSKSGQAAHSGANYLNGDVYAWEPGTAELDKEFLQVQFDTVYDIQTAAVKVENIILCKTTQDTSICID